MPIYEYKCPKCGVVEVMQRITEPALKKCPTCKSKVERQISLNSFVLKGTGWYASDYGKKTPPPSTSAETGGTSGDGAANGSASGSESKTAESKTESKSESKPKKESKPTTEKASAAKSAD
ncbi:MAG: zinc ribbon domain-containing protein [Candidatus Binataceae bacterium]